MLPAGREEAQDWAHALDRVANSIATNERLQRKVAEAMATYQKRLAVIESKFEASVVFGETTRAYLYMQQRFVKVEDGNHRDEAHREDMSSSHVQVHHNLDCQSILVECGEALEIQIQIHSPRSGTAPKLADREQLQCSADRTRSAV